MRQRSHPPTIRAGQSVRRRVFRVLALAGLLLPLSLAAAPQRVIALAPHITELLYAAGAGDRLVATVSSADYPPAVRALPRIGDGLRLNVETLLSYQPDTLIAWQPSAALQRLEPLLLQAGVQLHYAAPQTLDEIPLAIEQLGQLLDTRAQAEPVAQQMRARLRALRQRYAHRPPLKVLLDLGEFPIYTLANDSAYNSVLASCGGHNLYADSKLVAVPIDAESVLERQPDAVLVAASPERAARRLAYWQRLQLPAALQERVQPIDPDRLLRPGPRLLDAAAEVCAFLDQIRHTNNP